MNLNTLLKLFRSLAYIYLGLAEKLYVMILANLGVFPASEIPWLPRDTVLPPSLISTKDLQESPKLKAALELDGLRGIELPPLAKSNSASGDAGLVGEVVARPEEQSDTDMVAKCSKKKWLKTMKSLSIIKDSQSLSDFIQKETAERKECRKKCLTKHLSQDSWKSLRSKLKSEAKNQQFNSQKTRDEIAFWILFDENERQGKIPELEIAKLRSHYE